VSGSGVSLANTGAPIAGGVLGAVLALVGGIGLRVRRRR
jgi:LPXTG-motif cell wall-anchored protein